LAKQLLALIGHIEVQEKTEKTDKTNVRKRSHDKTDTVIPKKVHSSNNDQPSTSGYKAPQVAKPAPKPVTTHIVASNRSRVQGDEHYRIQLDVEEAQRAAARNRQSTDDVGTVSQKRLQRSASLDQPSTYIPPLFVPVDRFNVRYFKLLLFVPN
jgi:hypothetical protein